MPAPVFSMSGDDDIAAHIEQHPFAMLTINGEQGPGVALLPMVLDRTEGRLIGHLARNNQLVAGLKHSQPAVAVFLGHDAYVSPGWYPSKAEHGKAVPIWNYQAVEMRGDLFMEEDAGAMAAYLEPLTREMEKGRDTPWSAEDAPSAYIDRLHRGIVGLSLKISSARGVRKLSQNKSEADFHGVVEGLLQENNAVAQAVAHEMSKLGNR